MAKTNQEYILRVETYLKEKTNGKRAVVYSEMIKELNMKPDSLKETLAILNRFGKINIISNGKTTLVWIQNKTEVEENAIANN